MAKVSLPGVGAMLTSSDHCAPARETQEKIPAGERVITVALAGQPNVGKSTVFNMLTGLSQHVGNWPGKTIERKSR
jgi:GTP-binding protein EngB required for normal cell division